METKQIGEKQKRKSKLSLLIINNRIRIILIVSALLTIIFGTLSVYYFEMSWKLDPFPLPYFITIACFSFLIFAIFGITNYFNTISRKRMEEQVPEKSIKREKRKTILKTVLVGIYCLLVIPGIIYLIISCANSDSNIRRIPKKKRNNIIIFMSVYLFIGLAAMLYGSYVLFLLYG